MICKNCGKENLDTRDTCIYCKEKIDNNNQISTIKSNNIVREDIKNVEKLNKSDIKKVDEDLSEEKSEENKNYKSNSGYIGLLILHVLFWLWVFKTTIQSGTIFSWIAIPFEIIISFVIATLIISMYTSAEYRKKKKENVPYKIFRFKNVLIGVGIGIILFVIFIIIGLTNK